MMVDIWSADGSLLTRLEQLAQYRPPTLLFGLGGVFGGVVLIQVPVDPEPPTLQFFETVLPLLLLSPIFYTAFYVGHSDRAPERQSRILLLSGLFGVTAIGIVFLSVISESAAGIRFRELLFPVALSGAAGVGVGSVVGINYDALVATRTELEREVEQTQQLNQMLTVTNRVLRHNVRNTLTMVLSPLDEVHEQVEDPAIVDRIERCREALEKLQSNTENALQVDHLRDETTEVLVELGPILTTATERARDRAPTATIEVSMPSPVRVRTHPLLPVAIEEAIENAVKHNDPGELTVEVAVTQDPEWVTISIVDDGQGFSTSELDPLELDEETPLQHTTGVGMWLIKWVAEASDGTYKIRSNDSGGTTVRIQVPRG